MKPLFDYVCAAHGVFEATEAVCPHGCSLGMVRKVFLKPPGYHSDRTKSIDSTLQGLADDYKLTDINNQNGTSAAVRPDPRKLAERERLQGAIAEQLQGKLGDTSGNWGQMETGDTAIKSTLANQHLSADNALAPILSNLKAPTPLVVAKHEAKINPGGSGL